MTPTVPYAELPYSNLCFGGVGKEQTQVDSSLHGSDVGQHCEKDCPGEESKMNKISGYRNVPQPLLACNLCWPQMCLKAWLFSYNSHIQPAEDIYVYIYVTNIHACLNVNTLSNRGLHTHSHAAMYTNMPQGMHLCVLTETPVWTPFASTSRHPRWTYVHALNLKAQP